MSSRCKVSAFEMIPRAVLALPTIARSRRIGTRQSLGGSLGARASAARMRVALRSLAKAIGERPTLAIPAVEYQQDPVGFCADVLGITLLSDDQKTILLAMCTERELSVSSGNGVGKSFLHAVAAWWQVSCFPETVVFFTSTIDRQVLVNMWQPFAAIWKSAKFILGPKPGRNHHRPWLSADGKSKVLGGAPQTKEAVQGIRGHRTIVCVDEASGVSDEVNVGLQNLGTGAGFKFNTGNPTQSSGWFREKFKSKIGWLLSLSCLNSINVVQGVEIVPGLVSRAWVDDRRREWGEEDPRWKIHVLGMFLDANDLVVFADASIVDAFDAGATVDPNTALRVGVDLAGTGVDADKIVICFARGLVVTEFVDLTGTDIKGVTDYLKERLGDESAYVTYDAGGSVGKEFGEYWTGTHHIVTPCWAGAKSSLRYVYPSIRDEMPFRLKDFLRAGGKIAQDVQELREELAAIRIKYNGKNQICLEPKDNLRKILRRSPDHFDALCLCVYDWELTRSVRKQSKVPLNQAYKPKSMYNTGYAGKGR